MNLERPSSRADERTGRQRFSPHLPLVISLFPNCLPLALPSGAVTRAIVEAPIFAPLEQPETLLKRYRDLVPASAVHFDTFCESHEARDA